MTTFKELKNRIKEQQKEIAANITRGKLFRKPSNQINMTDDDRKKFCWKNSYRNTYEFDISRIDYLSRDFRSRHIAYCIFFNKTPYDKIESKVHDRNRPNLDMVQKYIKEWESEIICNNP